MEAQQGYQAVETADQEVGVLRADVEPKDILFAAQRPTLRGRIVEFIGMRANGMSNVAIAKAMGIHPHTLNTHICKAIKDGWLKFDDPVSRFENEIVPKVVDNIDFFINQRDKTMTIEAAKGAGVFKSYQAIRTETTAPQTILAIKIETISPLKAKEISVGHIVGKARGVIEGEISGGK